MSWLLHTAGSDSHYVLNSDLRVVHPREGLLDSGNGMCHIAGARRKKGTRVELCPSYLPCV